MRKTTCWIASRSLPAGLMDAAWRTVSAPAVRTCPILASESADAAPIPPARTCRLVYLRVFGITGCSHKVHLLSSEFTVSSECGSVADQIEPVVSDDDEVSRLLAGHHLRGGCPARGSPVDHVPTWSGGNGAPPSDELVDDVFSTGLSRQARTVP